MSAGFSPRALDWPCPTPPPPLPPPKNNNETVDASSGYRGHVYMVFDYCEHDLTGYMARLRGSLSVPEVKCVALQLLKGLAHLHAGGVLHRDLKASNLLLTSGGRLQLADFGLAREHLEQGSGARLTNRVITLWYR